MILSLLLGSLALAQPAPVYFPEVQNFKDVAEFTVRELGKETASRDWMLALHHELTQAGLKILARYRARHPACAPQLDLLRQELPQMRGQKIEDILSRHHDGVGIPSAPQHCIYGRVYVIHPVVNLIRAERGATGADRATMAADLQELLQYLPKLQKNLEPETPKEN